MTRACPAVLAVACVLAVAGSVHAQDALSVSLGAGAVRPGAVVLLKVSAAEEVERVGVRVFDRDVRGFRTGPRTWEAVVGVDLDVAPASYAMAVEAVGRHETSRLRTPLAVLPRRFSTRRLSVDPAFVEPPSAVVGRILDEARRLESLWATSTYGDRWTGAFVAPVPSRSSGRFGARSIFNGAPRAPHGGEDFASPTGTPVVAPNQGRVVLVGDLYFTGTTVVIDHGLEVFSLMAHLSATDVREGDLVAAGQRVGRVGATGRVTGPHLHWAVRVGGARVDPASLLETLGPARTPTTR